MDNVYTLKTGLSEDMLVMIVKRESDKKFMIVQLNDGALDPQEFWTYAEAEKTFEIWKKEGYIQDYCKTSLKDICEPQQIEEDMPVETTHRSKTSIHNKRRYAHTPIVREYDYDDEDYDEDDDDFDEEPFDLRETLSNAIAGLKNGKAKRFFMNKLFRLGQKG